MTDQNEDKELFSEDFLEDGEKMYYETRRYLPLASRFCFDVTRRPAQAVDKYSLKSLITGIFVGSFLIFLGFAPNFFSSVSTFKMEASESVSQSISLESWLFFVLGGVLIFKRIVMSFSRREFLIGNSVVSIVIKRLFEKNTRKSAPLSAYLGVRDRTRMVTWYGLISRTQHIIDLQHPDETKTIPLYVSYDGTGINDRWVRYAKQLKKPALFYTADECINVPLDDIQTSHPELIKKGIIEIDETNLYKLPKSVKIIENEKQCVIRPQIRDGAFTLFAALLCIFSFFMIAGLTVILSSHLHLTNVMFLLILAIALLLLVIIPLALFLRRRKIIISPKGITIKSVWLGVPSLGELIKPDELEYVKIVQSSHDKKYSVVIGANGQTTHIGRGAAKTDLEWLCNFINAKIKRFMN